MFGKVLAALTIGLYTPNDDTEKHVPGWITLTILLLILAVVAVIVIVAIME